MNAKSMFFSFTGLKVVTCKGKCVRVGSAWGERWQAMAMGKQEVMKELL